MIKRVHKFTVVCDKCNADASEIAGFSLFSDKSFAEDIAVDAGFIKKGDEHYCLDCQYYEDEDQLPTTADNDSDR
jgi:hypothetical protein